jgi:hypothetical protein
MGATSVELLADGKNKLAWAPEVATQTPSSLFMDFLILKCRKIPV